MASTYLSLLRSALSLLASLFCWLLSFLACRGSAGLRTLAGIFALALQVFGLLLCLDCCLVSTRMNIFAHCLGLRLGILCYILALHQAVH